ncbi:MAG: tyrosine--tRNA ligase [Thermofilum sp.]|nr:tyrosine--tRNA ligase [Thermofilum sp.]
MDLEERLALLKNIAGDKGEIVTEKELKILLETKSEPVAYDGFEPSGFAHLPLGVYRPLLLRDIVKAGVRFKLLLADTFAWINNKLGGDIEKIREAARYFVEVWRVSGENLGLDFSKVEVVWHKDFFDDPEYWRKVLLIAKSHTLKRTARALTIAGRVAREEQPTAFYFYPSMQCADIFHIKADICQLGLDQRKVNVLAREIATTEFAGRPLYMWLGYEGCGVNGKPVLLHHRMLPSLGSPVEVTGGFDEEALVDVAISSKMSKSKPETSIYVHDPPEVIERKVRRAFCPPQSKIKLTVRRKVGGQEKTEEVVVENPVLVYVKEIVFRAYGRFELMGKREETYYDYSELERDYDAGKIDPLDLKISLARALDSLIAPVRRHFEEGPGRKLYELVRTFEVTR